MVMATTMDTRSSWRDSADTAIRLTGARADSASAQVRLTSIRDRDERRQPNERRTDGARPRPARYRR